MGDTGNMGNMDDKQAAPHVDAGGDEATAAPARNDGTVRGPASGNPASRDGSFAEAATIPMATPAAGSPFAAPKAPDRARHSAHSVASCWRDAPAPVKRTRLLVVTLALVLAVVASTTLAALVAADGGIPAFSLFAPHAAAATASPTTPPSEAGQSTAGTEAQRVTESPQGCVNGVAPEAAQGPYGPIFSLHGNPHIHNEVALTFDDGPAPTFTPQILAELKAAGVHATFFVVGHHAQLHPELVHSEWQAGNAIGNHTFNHDWIPGLSPDKLRANLAQTTQIIQKATGDSCVWLFRAPFGDYMPAVRVGPTATPRSSALANGTPSDTGPTPIPTAPATRPSTGKSRARTGCAPAAR